MYVNQVKMNTIIKLLHYIQPPYNVVNRLRKKTDVELSMVDYSLVWLSMKWSNGYRMSFGLISTIKITFWRFVSIANAVQSDLQLEVVEEH